MTSFNNSGNRQNETAGTYVLILQLRSPCNITIGKLGAFNFIDGYYLYIGSAFGPGGLKARIRRHLKPEKKSHWHIDYLSTAGAVIDTWISGLAEKNECHWARTIESVKGLSTPVPGFGSSDCACCSHLFYRPKKPTFESFRRLLGSGLKKMRV